MKGSSTEVVTKGSWIQIQARPFLYLFVEIMYKTTPISLHFRIMYNIVWIILKS